MATAKPKKTKPAFIIRNINDAGTGRRFAQGEIVDLEEGVFANYEAAGLVRAPKSDEAKAAKAAAEAPDPGPSAA